MASDALVITGPTAAGKTALSLAVAERLGGEIVSMDSRQVYRGMDIGTAKILPADRRGIPHHGLDLVDPDARYSAGAFARDARRWIADIRGRGRVPILVGGTGFFLRALTHPMFREPESETPRREALKRWLDAQPAEKLDRWLRALDADTAASLQARAGGAGRQRIARALEVALLTGRPLSWWHAHAPSEQKPLRFLVFVLDLPREELYRRIDARVHDMVRAGLVGEVRALVDAGFGPDAPGMNATGYIELFPYFAGRATLDEAVDAIQRATRRYARRQLTWFRHQLPPDAVRLDAMRPVRELADEIAAVWRREEAL
ncbi:MAG TPA: tRNA (adenosine(37)-N6)-dimethylallyltransferase MiaA [Longimicrobiales bacterium]|nr:tRNA (adenosine(37)-N6)-dimethylallyltransferase MiaA [Longimicrobiales bacterium]